MMDKILLRILNRKLFRILPSRLFVILKYRFILHKWPNIKNPSLLSEKIQWLKLNYFDERYPIYVDKFAVRNFVSKSIGDEYLVPLLGVWNNPEEIDWSSLPEKFVLKTTDGSHTNIICTNKNDLDVKSVIRQLKIWQKNDSTYYYGREWPYKYVKSKIIAEQFIESDDPEGIRDYKFLCFNGVADNVMICSNRNGGNVRFDHFDKQWNFLRYQYVDASKPDDYGLEKPEKIEEMFSIAEKLAKDLPFVRVDLYCEKGQIYFGELTFYPQSGFDTDFTEETDLYFGKKLILPKANKRKKRL